ncbi:MAG: thioredoxin [Eubacteriaceae bacterium]|nr:thioredoxin [Eubacteriaceae bacterium]
MSELKLTKNNFEEEVLKSEGLVLVDFWASWCGPCKMLAPVLEEIAEENKDIKVGKVNVDEEMELAQQFNIMSIPNLILFKDGKPVKQQVGFRGKEEIEKMWK